MNKSSKLIIPQLGKTYFVIDSQYVPEGLLSSIVPVKVTQIDIVKKNEAHIFDISLTYIALEYHCRILGQYTLNDKIININRTIIVYDKENYRNLWNTKEDAFEFMRSSLVYTPS